MTASANSESMLRTARPFSSDAEEAGRATEGVFLLDAEGPMTLSPLGWRGRPLAVKARTDEPAVLAREASHAVGVALEFHSVVQMQDQKWFVLRRLARRDNR